MYLRASGMGACNPYEFDSHGKSGDVKLVEGADPMHIFSYDHEGLHSNPLRIGLGTETYLQAQEIPYEVRYGKGDVWKYDPKTRMLLVRMTAEEFEKFAINPWDEMDVGEEPENA